MWTGVEGNVGHVSPQGKKNIVQQKTKEFVKLDSYFLLSNLLYVDKVIYPMLVAVIFYLKSFSLMLSLFSLY